MCSPVTLCSRLGRVSGGSNLLEAALCPYNGAAHKAGWTLAFRTHAWMSRLPSTCCLLPAAA